MGERPRHPERVHGRAWCAARISRGGSSSAPGHVPRLVLAEERAGRVLRDRAEGHLAVGETVILLRLSLCIAIDTPALKVELGGAAE